MENELKILKFNFDSKKIHSWYATVKGFSKALKNTNNTNPNSILASEVCMICQLFQNSIKLNKIDTMYKCFWDIDHEYCPEMQVHCRMQDTIAVSPLPINTSSPLSHISKKNWKKIEKKLIRCANVTVVIVINHKQIIFNFFLISISELKSASAPILLEVWLEGYCNNTNLLRFN